MLRRATDVKRDGILLIFFYLNLFIGIMILFSGEKPPDVILPLISPSGSERLDIEVFLGGSIVIMDTSNGSALSTITFVTGDKMVTTGHKIKNLSEGSHVYDVPQVEFGEKGIKEFAKGQYLGTVKRNLETGVYSSLDAPFTLEKATKIKTSQYVRLGSAYIYCDIGEGPKYYPIRIYGKFLLRDAEKNNDSYIELCKFKTTGETPILSGMSGSPIVQAGYLIGAAWGANEEAEGFFRPIGDILEDMEGAFE